MGQLQGESSGAVDCHSQGGLAQLASHSVTQPWLGAEAGPWAHPSPPCSGLVRGQTEQSMAEVPPHHCAEYLPQRDQNCTHDCCKDPEFGSIPAEVGQCWDGCGEKLFPCPWDALAFPNPLLSSIFTVLEVGSRPHHPLCL